MPRTKRKRKSKSKPKFHWTRYRPFFDHRVRLPRASATMSRVEKNTHWQRVARDQAYRRWLRATKRLDWGIWCPCVVGDGCLCPLE